MTQPPAEPSPARHPAPLSLKGVTLTPRPSTSANSSRRGPGRWLGWLGFLGLTGGIVGGYAWFAATSDDRDERVRELPRQSVRRVDFRTRMTASGRVESVKKTVISCELESVSVSANGQTIRADGSQIIEVVDEGARVKKGDVLCRLNATDYEEMVRTQEMRTEQARAALEQAKLNFAVAELAVEEYKGGLSDQKTQSMEGAIALAESDLKRAIERLEWIDKMLLKGYVARSQKTVAERTIAMLNVKLLTSRWSLKNFKNYSDPRFIKELLAEVEKRRFEVIANTSRTTRFEERLAHYRKMVEYCTIVAPHDGIVIYVQKNWRGGDRLQPGVAVHEKQDLFYLPDLSRMQVVTYLHESVAAKVRPGMSAQVKLEGVGGALISGKVSEIAPLPVTSPSWNTSEEVQYLLATVKLDEAPSGLLPGMSAEVEINPDSAEDVLAVPAEAVAFEGGRDVCYVAGAHGLERREVTLGRSSRDLLEVKDGLAEGEQVVINPADLDAIESLLAQPSTIRPPDRGEQPTVTGPVTAPAEPVVADPATRDFGPPTVD